MRNIYSPIEVDEDELLRNDEAHELLYAKINTLPENVQDILFDEHTDETLKKISNELQLNQNQTIEMARLVRDLLIKDIYLGNIILEAANRLQIGENTARDIANRLVSDLFVPALEEIKKLHTEKFGPSTNSRQTQKSTTPTSFQPTTPKQESNVNPNNVLDLRK